MARIPIEEITCDVCGADASLSRPDVAFRWQGVDYIIDLCDEHYELMSRGAARRSRCAERAEEREARMTRVRKLHGMTPSAARRAGAGAAGLRGR